MWNEEIAKMLKKRDNQIGLDAYITKFIDTAYKFDFAGIIVERKHVIEAESIKEKIKNKKLKNGDRVLLLCNFNKNTFYAIAKVG